ncbi:hypothetical protein [Alkalibacterium pelagium]|uniref:RiboL-PSP-HEPN domain-containing protein n=1 Tax=Alkalibacterium pelagium TaxID=426702 RepID=A0A1H7JWX3_9LACT|nr:hypothetical protein [Alkalibacterium pelagium]GEN50517.1 hypothetical protein APE02nite_11820 [Alkalibacterium pelagium]SEK79088.1 hypothetical protein SAMN04488099_10694 [Alkalibacterium pelagium]
MEFSTTPYDDILVIFEKTLNVSLIAENINTCSLEDEIIEVVGEMTKNDYDVYGVEGMGGKVIGYLQNDNSSQGKVKSNFKKFDSDELLSDSTSLLKLLEVLRTKNRMFVLENNTVEKIVTVADLNKQPMRMLIFSFISILEMQLTGIIKETFPNDEWLIFLTHKRIENAKEKYNYLVTKNNALSLIDSTQLCDKGTIIKRSKKLRLSLGFDSGRKCETFFSKLEDLRNNTAHSQENIYTDSRELIDLILSIKSTIETIQNLK